MLNKRRFDLEGTHPNARHLQHVVAAPGIGIGAVRIAHVLVAGLGPAALKSLARLGAISPIHDRRRWALDVEVARVAVGHGSSILATKLDVVTRDRPPGGAVANLVAPVGEEDMQHLGRANAVDDVDAEVRLESLA